MARPSGGYRNASGEKVPGVTTVIGRFKESGGLLWWANRLAYDPLGKAYALLSAPNEEKIKEFLATPLESYDHMKARDSAADAGTLAHAMVEAYLRGQDPHTVALKETASSSEVLDKAETAFLAFLEWAGQTELKVVESELSMVSERHRVGGTLDCCVLSINGNLCIGDFKTGSGIYTDALIQVAQYGEMYCEHNPEARIHGYYVIRFDRNTADFTVRFFNNLDEAKRAFVLMRELFDIDKALKKRVK